MMLETTSRTDSSLERAFPWGLLEKQRGRSRSPSAYNHALAMRDEERSANEIIKSHTHPLTDPAYFAKLHDGFSAGGLTVRTQVCKYLLSFVHLQGAIYDRHGVAVGRIGYQATVDEQDEIGVSLSMFTLDPSSRGTDFSAAYNQYLDGIYTREGADYMTVHASGLGSYVWAKQGFLFDSAYMEAFSAKEGAQRSAADMIERGIRSAEAEYPQQIDPQLRQSFREQLQRPEALTPGSLSQFGKEASFATSEGRMWLGKCAFLHGSWPGVKFF